MPQPTLSEVHVDKALSQISIAYKNEGYIAQAMFPDVRVDHKTDKYFIWTKDFWFRNYVQVRTPGDTYPEAGLGLSTSDYSCILYHLGYPIPDEIVENQDDAVDIEAAGAEWLADQFLLNRETLLATEVFVATPWTSSTTLSGTNQWSDFANSDPINDVKTGRQTIQKLTAREPNTMVVGKEVFDYLTEHPLLLDKFKYTRVGILDGAQVCDALKIPRILVGSAIANAAQEAAAFNGEYIWGKNALLMYVAPTPGRMVPSAGYTFIWNIDGGGLTVAVSRVREDNRDRDLLKAKHAFDLKVTGADLGYYIATAVA